MLEIVSEELRCYQEKKLADYRDQNKVTKRGGIVFAGDSLVEFFPLKKAFGVELPLVNRGIAGIDSQWLLTHCEDQITDLEPEKVFLLIGCNDIGLGYDENHIVKTIVELINHIRSHSIYSQIYLLSLLPVSQNPDYQATVKVRTNTVINTINQELSMIPAIEFIDVNACLKDSEGGLSGENTLDGLHLNFQAYDKIAQVIKDYL
ncbi:UNVERIFIED_CONTAM: lipase [Streptococcus canis]